ncbi:MAG: DUF4143 domain-containing protein, partial [Candidatus Falkowbacteria bacterium]
NRIVEPLTGRKYEFKLYPLSLAELKTIYNELEIKRLIEKRIIFGMYPEIISENNGNLETRLKTLAKSYLYKDVLQFQNLKHAEAIDKLLQALALQIGSEVSYNELAGIVGLDKKTIAAYIQILERAFIIFRLTPFSRNLRNELKKLRKIYFFDNGIRNALINNFNPAGLRQDFGALWENFVISERIKYNYNNNQEKNIYFWRTKEGREIDYIEEAGGRISAYEIKWKKEKIRTMKAFLNSYNVKEVEIINKDNFEQFLMAQQR